MHTSFDSQVRKVQVPRHELQSLKALKREREVEGVGRERLRERDRETERERGKERAREGVRERESQ